MNPASAELLRRRLGPLAVRLVLTLPLAWRSTPRRRRFLLLGACTPGFAAIVALPAHKSLWLLLLGTAWVAAACGLRALSEPTLTSGGNRD